MKYAVQVRDMHTAYHMLLIYDKRQDALEVMDFARFSGDDLEFSKLPVNPSDLAEIDWRRPPSEHKGEELTILNPDRVYDIWEG